MFNKEQCLTMRGKIYYYLISFYCHVVCIYYHLILNVTTNLILALIHVFKTVFITFKYII